MNANHMETASSAAPCVMVIFGATGDLTKRKLIPALLNLAQESILPRQFAIVGFAVNDLDTDSFRKTLGQEMPDFAPDPIDLKMWDDLSQRIYFVKGDFEDPAAYERLKQQIDEAAEAHHTGGNKFFYLAVAPRFFAPIVNRLGAAGLTKQEDDHWTRVIIEKPFGHDLESARQLNCNLKKTLTEKQIYRIDHYLGKETVQNIIMFRFGNSMFEPVWNRNYIDYIEITAAETLGVENRAAFYEETGALRDMVANHMLQLLTLTAMEPPIAFDSDAVREQKVQVLRSIHPMTKDQVAARTIRGQYGPGTIDGEPVQGYRQEEGVNPNSNTETYVAVEFHVNNWRWAGVPFYVRAGKRLSRPLTEVAVHFKRTPQALFSQRPEDVHHNVVALRIQPNEGISLTFGAKTPGQHMRASIVTMDFSYRDTFGAATPVAYETLLLDAMRGDATLFTRRDEVESEWRIITPIEEAWAQLPPPRFANYAAGSEGPPEADELIQYDRHRWRPLEDKDGWRL